MTENMIERVSEALCKGVCKHCRRACVGPGEGVTPECNRTDCEWEPGTRLEKARAAIEAMREPTEAMCRIAERDHEIFDASMPWQTMIDAALQWPPGSADRAGVPMAEE